jgi:hypothetical protein
MPLPQNQSFCSLEAKNKKTARALVLPQLQIAAVIKFFSECSVRERAL